MRINHNLMAMNTNRQLGISNKAGAKSMEKLSSGFRINRAADDAAGLSISEKMRNQIRGLERASANSQDGISLIQTAEGALDETHAILKRMRELTVQAGNEGTLQQDDLEAIRDEFAELSGELDGIADRTEFNGKKLLNGKYSGTLQIGANQKQQLDLDVAVKTINGSKGQAVLEDVELVKGSRDAKIEGYQVADKINIKGADLKGVEFKLSTDVEYKETTASMGKDGKLTINLKNKEVSPATDPKTYEIDDITYDDIKAALAKSNPELEVTILGDPAAVGVEKITAGSTLAADGEDHGTTKANGSTSSGDLGVKLSGTAFKKETDGTDNLDEILKEGTFFGFEGMEQKDVKKATDANLERLDAANKAVSKVRSHLGANQNRLEHTIKNLDNAAENIQASESRIRDVDMAKEMIENTKQNILQQASTAMLAQANQAPQTVLRLLG